MRSRKVLMRGNVVALLATGPFHFVFQVYLFKAQGLFAFVCEVSTLQLSYCICSCNIMQMIFQMTPHAQRH